METVAALRTTLSWLTLPAPNSFVHILRSCKLTASQQCWRATQGWSSIFHSTHVRRQYMTQAGQWEQLGTKCFSNCFWCRLRGKQQQVIAGIRMIGSNSRPRESQYKRTVIIYVCAAGIFMLGMSYAGVPLYRMFCQATGLGGTVQKGHDTSKISEMQKVEDRVIRVRFNADVASSMRWNFKPQQTEVKVFPGETALAFYTAKNPTDKPIIGISTYNVVPFEAGQYFNKIQCFCFEEQRLNPHEQVDMPVFFYIDPEFAEDHKLKNVDTITLSYTFFEAKEGLSLPLPGYMAQ